MRAERLEAGHEAIENKCYECGYCSQVEENRHGSQVFDMLSEFRVIGGNFIDDAFYSRIEGLDCKQHQE